MLKFLREYEMSKLFSKISSETQIKIAVPFWGHGGMKSLGLRKGQSVEIICNLNSGGCNPYVVEKLLEAKFKVRSHHRLHAKMYVLPKSVIVGSSNVSTNGLAEGVADKKGWIEANVHTDDPTVVGDTQSLFQDLWEQEETKMVELDGNFLESAKKAWDTRPSPRDPIAATTLIAACRENPDAFKSVFLAIYDEDIGPKATEMLQTLRRQAASKPSLGAADFRNAYAYQFKINPGSWIIDFDFMLKLPRIRGCAQVQTPPTILKVSGEPSVTLAIRGDVRLPALDREFKLTPKDKNFLEKNSDLIWKLAADRGLVPLSEAIDVIDRA
jgi:hypothetical protein